MEVTVEIFLPIIISGVETDYLISNYGRVKSLKNNIILKNQSFNSGREYVNMYISGVMYRRQISRLVAIAFIPNPNNLPEVNHKDGNIKNNFVLNLEWITSEDNKRHAKENFLLCKGEESHLNKYSEDLIVNICDELLECKTPKELSIKYDLSQTYISDLRDKKMWRHITINYNFPSRSMFNYSSNYSIELKEEITKLIKLNCTNAQIRKKLNLEKTNAIRNMIDRIRKRLKN